MHKFSWRTMLIFVAAYFGAMLIGLGPPISAAQANNVGELSKTSLFTRHTEREDRSSRERVAARTRHPSDLCDRTRYVSSKSEKDFDRDHIDDVDGKRPRPAAEDEAFGDGP